MNVERRWWATSVVQVRVLAAMCVLVGAGCAVLGWRSHLRQNVSLEGATPVVSGQPMMAQDFAPVASAGSVMKTDLANQARSILDGLPLYFEPNQGQANLDPADARARFVNRGSGYSLFLGSQGAILGLVSHDRSKKGSAARGEYLQMKLAGANPYPVLSASDALPGKSHYFIGSDSAKWHTNVPHFARVRYENVYPGINLVFYGKQGQLEYDFQVAPGADPSLAELDFNGAKTVELNGGGLLIAGNHGSLRLEAPRVYQEIDGKQLPVEGKFVLRGAKRAGFALGSYDRSRELIIDPVLNFSTYFGGSGDEHASSVAVDGSFNVYLTGSTTSPNLPVTTCGFVGCGTLNGAQNVYIAKLTPPLGSVAAILDDVAYLGGSGTDTPAGVKVDGAENIYLAGTTSSPDFPTRASNAYQATPYAGSKGTTHAFVSKVQFDFTQLNYSSYLSGNGTDAASGMTIDAVGDIFVTGTTTSNNIANANTGIQFPASIQPAQYSAYQPISRGAIQFFVTEVSTEAAGSGSILFSTYFGGANFTPPAGQTLPTAIGGGIAVDTTGNIYFTGTTNFTYTGCPGCATTDFPILNAFQPCLDTPQVTIPVNPPTCTPSTPPAAPDAFVAKLNPAAGQQLIWSTYVGGSSADYGNGIALDVGAANVYIVGTTNSSDIGQSYTLSTLAAAFQQCLDQPGTPPCTTPATPPTDAFVARLTNATTSTTSVPTNVTLNYFTYLGGSNNDQGLAITVDTASGAVVTGWTQSTDFPVYPPANPIQSVLYDQQAAFVARINTSAVTGTGQTGSWASYFGGACVTNPAPPPTCLPYVTAGTGVALDVNQDTYLAGETNSPALQVAKPLTQGTVINGGYDAFVAQLQTAVSLSITGVLSLGTNQTLISAGNSATFTYTITNNGPDLATGITVAANMDPAVTVIPLTNITASLSSGTCSSGTSSGTSISCGPISLQSGSTATLTINATPTSNGLGGFFNGGTIQAMAPGNIVLATTSVSAQMSDFSMTVTPSNQNIPQAGSTATYTVNLIPHPLYNSSITLSCSGFPSGSSCQFTPSSISLQSASGGTVTLAIPTTARPATPTASLFVRRFYAIWLIIPGLALFGISGDRRRRKIIGISMLCLIFVLLMFLPACSHSTTQTPAAGTQAGNYTITVTATSGTDSKSQTITLNVP